MIAWLMLGAAMAAAPSEPSGVSSSAALTLAKAASDRVVPQGVLDQTANGIAQSLLNTLPAWKGVGCDPQVAACRLAAEQLGREAAGTILAERRAIKNRMLAIVIDETMTSADIADATVFLRTSAGRSFAAALERLSEPAAMSPKLRERLGKAMLVSPPADVMHALFDRFHDMTATLPRRALPLVPPPPQPSLPARKP